MDGTTKAPNVSNLNHEPRLRRADEILAMLERQEQRAAERRRLSPRVLPRTACGWCGSTSGLRETVDHLTVAPAMICVDDIACLRRMATQKAAA